jgi:hypothetical protein
MNSSVIKLSHTWAVEQTQQSLERAAIAVGGSSWKASRPRSTRF